MDVPVLYPALSDKYNAKIMQIIKSLPSHYSREKKTSYSCFIFITIHVLYLLFIRERKHNLINQQCPFPRIASYNNSIALSLELPSSFNIFPPTYSNKTAEYRIHTEDNSTSSFFHSLRADSGRSALSYMHLVQFNDIFL